MKTATAAHHAAIQPDTSTCSTFEMEEKQNESAGVIPLVMCKYLFCQVKESWNQKTNGKDVTNKIHTSMSEILAMTCTTIAVSHYITILFVSLIFYLSQFYINSLFAAAIGCSL